MASAQRIRNLIDPLLEKEGVTIYNLVRNEDIPAIDKQTNVQVVGLKYSIKNPFSFLFFFISAFRFLLKVRDKKAKNIFYCYDYPCIENIIILFFVRLFNYKIVFDIVEDVYFADFSKSTWHVKLYHYTSFKMRSYIPRWGSACFGISEYLVDKCEQICKGKIPVYNLPICVNIEKIESIKLTTDDKNELSVFYGGSFGFKDGIHFLIKGFEIAIKSQPNIQLILTGKVSRQLEKEFDVIINNSFAKGNITYLGCLPEDVFFSTMVNADILCMVRVNSAFANAGFPFKLGEYLASGNAVIATSVGDVGKFLTHKGSAYLIAPESPQDIANAIVELVENKDLRNTIGIAGKNVAKIHFDNKIVADKLYQILISI